MQSCKVKIVQTKACKEAKAKIYCMLFIKFRRYNRYVQKNRKLEKA